MSSFRADLAARSAFPPRRHHCPARDRGRYEHSRSSHERWSEPRPRERGARAQRTGRAALRHRVAEREQRCVHGAHAGAVAEAPELARRRVELSPRQGDGGSERRQKSPHRRSPAPRATLVTVEDRKQSSSTPPRRPGAGAATPGNSTSAPKTAATPPRTPNQSVRDATYAPGPAARDRCGQKPFCRRSSLSDQQGSVASDRARAAGWSAAVESAARTPQKGKRVLSTWTK